MGAVGQVVPAGPGIVRAFGRTEVLLEAEYLAAANLRLCWILPRDVPTNSAAAAGERYVRAQQTGAECGTEQRICSRRASTSVAVSFRGTECPTIRK